MNGGSIVCLFLLAAVDKTCFSCRGLGREVISAHHSMNFLQGVVSFMSGDAFEYELCRVFVWTPLHIHDFFS